MNRTRLRYFCYILILHRKKIQRSSLRWTTYVTVTWLKCKGTLYLIVTILHFRYENYLGRGTYVTKLNVVTSSYPASVSSFICMFHLFLKSSLFRDYSRKSGFCDGMGHTSTHRLAPNSRNGPIEALINTVIRLSSNPRDDQACFIHDIL